MAVFAVTSLRNCSEAHVRVTFRACFGYERLLTNLEERSSTVRRISAEDRIPPSEIEANSMR